MCLCRCACGYRDGNVKKPEICLLGTGTGGTEEIKALFTEDNVVYALLRVVSRIARNISSCSFFLSVTNSAILSQGLGSETCRGHQACAHIGIHMAQSHELNPIHPIRNNLIIKKQKSMHIILTPSI